MTSKLDEDIVWSNTKVLVNTNNKHLNDGEDVTALMAAQAAGEIAFEIDTEICNDLYRMAGAGTELVWSKTQPVGVKIA